MARRKRDEAAKLLFTGAVVADALRAGAAELATMLDLDSIDPRPTEYIAEDRSKRFGDAVFRVKFRKGRFPRAADGGRRPRRLYLLLAAEFQDRNEAKMLARVRDYAMRMDAHYRHQGIVRAGEHPAILALVIHTGPGRWSADDGGEALRLLPADAARLLAAHQPLAYIPLDAGGHTTLALQERSRLKIAAALAGSATVEDLAAHLHAGWALFDGAADEPLRRGMLAWAEETAAGLRDSTLQLPSYEDLEGLEVEEMAYLLKDKIKRWEDDWESKVERGREQGLERGRAEGIDKGRREILEDLARRRFGAAASRLLSAKLNGSPSRQRFAELGDIVLRCDTAEEFAAQLDG